MAKTQQLVGDLIDEIQMEIDFDGQPKVIPDIITFVEDKEWLGLPHHESNPIHLFPMQKIMLKVFYRGSLGNENLELTETELAMLEELGLNNDENGHVIDKYSAEQLFRELVLVWGRRCLSEDMTIVNPEDGSINRIGELWDKNVKQINSWTYDQEKNKMVEIKDADIIFQGERECYELTTNSGNRIECTNNHPFLTQRGWVQLKDLDVEDDKVAIAEEIPFFGDSDKINEDEAAILGYMTGDGSCSQRATFFTCDNKKVLRDFTNRLNNFSDNLKIFNDPWTGAKSKKNQYKITSDKYENETFFSEKEGRNRSRRRPNDLMKLMEKWDLAGKTCHYKTTPLELFKCPKKVIASYLRSLFSCDGNLHSRKNSNLSTFEFTTVNKSQAELVQQLLYKFGIISNLRTKRVISRIIDEKNTIRKYDTECYIIHFSRKRYLRRFIDEIGLIGKDKFIKRAENNLSKINDTIKTVYKDDKPFSFSKIKSIEKIGKKRTFDLSVSDKKTLQNFVSQGFIVHNSGKDFIVSIIALYEAMKLLECPGGDPYAMYGLSSATPINILTVATAKQQSGIAFSEIRDKLFNSAYFQDKYFKDGITSGSIYLLTPKDKQDNKEFKEKGLPLKKGSIGIIVGHSNSDSLLGMGCIVLILDEVASYKTTGGSSSGDRIYAALTPTVQTYVRKEYELGEDGTPVLNEHGQKVISRRIYDGKVISISSPRAKEGKFFELFNTARDVPNRLAMRVATWNVNPYHTRESLRQDNTSMSETEFNMEYGAEFSGTGLESFFTEEQVKPCFIGHNLMNRDMGSPGKIYFVHLDPATSSHNYALIILHKEFFLNIDTQKADFRIVVDHIKYWQPVHGPINPNEVIQYVINLKRRFHIGLVTYDQWACVSPEEYLYTDRGVVKAKEITKEDYLLSKDGVKNKVQALGYKDGVDGFEIKTKFGYTLRGNDIHPVYVKDRGFVEMQELRKGDNILLKDFEYNFGNIHKPTEAIIMGMFGKCNTKEVPKFIMEGDKETVSKFLSSLFEGDGTIQINPNVLSVQYDTTSKILAKQVQLLLLSFGIKSSLKCYDSKCSYSNRLPEYRVVIYGDNILVYFNEIGFRSSVKNNKLKECVNLQLLDKREIYKNKSRGIREGSNKKSRSRYMYDKIISITPITTDIIHIEVDGDHTYIANGVVSHNSQESILKLRKAGIPNKETRFTGAYKFQIYKELEDIVNSKRLSIPYDHVLYNEMIELQRKFTPTGFKVMPRTEGDGMKSDDVVDCLAGACYVAIEKQISRLPGGKLVALGNPSGGSIVWRNMQGGVYGIGPGARVATALERRASWPMYKRR